MVTTTTTNNRVNLVQVCSLNIEQSRLLQLVSAHLGTLLSTKFFNDGVLPARCPWTRKVNVFKGSLQILLKQLV